MEKTMKLYRVDYKRAQIYSKNRSFANWSLFTDLGQAKAQAQRDAELVRQIRFVVKVEDGYTVCSYSDHFDPFDGCEIVHRVEAPPLPAAYKRWSEN